MIGKGLVALTIILLSGCVVEAGNPSSKKPKQGSVSLYFAKTLDTSNQNLQLNIDNVDVSSSTSTDQASSFSLTPDQKEVEIFSLKETDDTAVVNSKPANAGVYDQIAIHLSSQKPVSRRDSNGADSPVDTDQIADNTFYLSQSFEIKEGEETQVIIRLDGHRSLVLGDGHVAFHPMGNFFPRNFGQDYEGKAPSAEFNWVCAYAYGISPPPRGGMMRETPIGKPNMPPPQHLGHFGRAFAALPPKSFATKDEVKKDATSACDNAFVKAEVVGQNFKLRHLPPGNFSFRFFKSDDSFEDASADVTIEEMNDPPLNGH